MSKWWNATFVQIWWRNKLIYISTLRLYLFLLLLGCFDDTRVGLPGLAKVVEESQTVEQEGQVDGDEREMCGELRKLCLIWKWSDMWPSMLTHTRNSCSAFTHPSAHTAVNTHTHTVNTHPEQWAAIYAAAHGEQLGVRCLAQGQLAVVLKVERPLDIHSPHRQFLPDETRTHNL